MTKIVNMCKSESYESIPGEILSDDNEHGVMSSEYA